MVNLEIFKILKYHTFLKKQFFLLFVVSVAVKTERYLKKKNQLNYEKFLGKLKIYNYLIKNRGKNASLGFRLKIIDETRNYLLQETKHNGLVSKKDKKL